MKKVLIISPHFPPVNAADVQRVRHSLPYFRQLGWEVEVIAVDEKFVETYSYDPLLNKTIPSDIKVHKVAAFDVSKTRKYGLGSLSMRSFFHYRRMGNKLLRKGNFDLVYFSTTAFHVMALGRYWKQKFGVPFVLDLQDPWRNDFYLDKPKTERPPKFVISYNVDKYLEMYAMKKVDGIISVSQGYVDTLLDRYKYLKPEQFTVIPFGYSTVDFDVMEENVKASGIQLQKDKVNIVYIGRGGHDMRLSTECFFRGLKKLVDSDERIREQVHCWFIGTSYAQSGKGSKTIAPIADKVGVGEMVTESTDRVPFFETLFLLKHAQGLFIPGSTDKAYTASKIYQYVLAEKPLLAVFYKGSSVISILKQAETGTVVPFDDNMQITDDMVNACAAYVQSLLDDKNQQIKYNKASFEEYSALTMTKRQVDFFNKVLSK